MYPAIDWNQVWQEMLQENLNSRGSSGCSTFWNTAERAADFLRGSREEGAERIQVMIDALNITANSRVLDIGAGPGSLAIPLSSKAGHITAIEPAAPMVALFKEEIERTGATNITIVEKHWEEVRSGDIPEPFDRVIAAYSLGMPDLQSAILKMQESCCGTIYIFYSAGKPFWEEMMISLWPHLHDSSYHPGPKVNVIWNLLYQMGICADIKVTPLVQKNRYRTIDDAVEVYIPRMKITTSWQRELLSRYLKTRMQICTGQYYCLSGTVLHACISWNVKKEKSDFNP